MRSGLLLAVFFNLRFTFFLIESDDLDLYFCGGESEDVVDDDRYRDLLLFLNLMCESEEASEELSATEEDSSEDAI